MEEIGTLCPNCKNLLPVVYQDLGITKWCNSCLHDTIPIIPLGSLIPGSGYAITYGDFKSLISDPEYRVPVGGFLKTHFQFSIAGAGREHALILNEQGQAIDPVWLHHHIQGDEALQNQLYNIAMTLWR